MKVDLGFTDRGFKIWCQKHHVKIYHFNFEGKRPKVDFRCLEKKRLTETETSKALIM